MTDEEYWKYATRGVTPLTDRGSVDMPKFPLRAPTRHVCGTFLDLHGMTVQCAHRAVRMAVSQCREKHITIVTGKSGQIRQEFPSWLNGLTNVHSYRMVSDGGAFVVQILKSHR